MGGYQGLATGTVELEARRGGWSLAPAIDVVRGDNDLHAFHVDVRKLFYTEHIAMWIGAGPTFVRSNLPASENTWNFDAGFAWRMTSAWEPYIAARYYTYDMPVFHDEIRGRGATISIGISRRF
jgi:hypothetical protein